MRTRSGHFKRLAAVLIAAVFTLMPIHSVLSDVMLTGVPAGTRSNAMMPEKGYYSLEPRLSDGIDVRENYDGSMRIAAHCEGDLLVFDETKDVCFEAEYASGWTPCETYSVFFTDDPRAYVTQTDESTFIYGFSAEAGDSVSLEDWDAVAINATAAELPKLYIDAVVSFDEIDRDTWVEATYTLTLGTKQFESGDYSGTGTVKGRGNSSWNYDKKPYSIKLDKKESLLDIPKTKKYAIIPSYYDGSLMRNFITYKAYQELKGIGYVPKCEFVDVYLNGTYNGIYILSERIDIEKTKVNIVEADADNLSGGYLIEKDVNGRVDFAEDLWFNCPYWANQSKDYFVLKAPEPEDPELADQMLDYLEDYMQRLHDCVINENGEDYHDYVDTSSWVDFIIVQEIAKNIDGNMKTSCWMYKDRDDDHLYMTAPWDFDFAYGLVSWSNASQEHNDYYDCPPCNTYDEFQIVNSSNPWMDKLYDEEEDFRTALMERYTEYRHTIIDELFALINEEAAYLSTAQEANYAIWSHRNFHAGVRKLRTWLTGRIEWLDSKWLLETETVDLDPALNIPGGDIHFETGDPSFEGVSIDGVELAAASGEGEKSFSAFIDFGYADFIDFDCLIEGEGASLKLLVDGEEVISLGEEEAAEGDGRDGEPGLTNIHYIIFEPGIHELCWIYSGGEDGRALVDNVSVNFGFELGDVDMNGTIDSADALVALRIAIGSLTDERGALLADINGSGFVGSDDALVILRRVLGLR